MTGFLTSFAQCNLIMSYKDELIWEELVRERKINTLNHSATKRVDANYEYIEIY